MRSPIRSGMTEKMNNDLLYYLGFSHFLGIGPVKFSLLKNHFRFVKKAYLADKKELENLIGPSLTEKFIHFRDSFDPIKKLADLKKRDIQVIAIDDPDYPESLKNIPDPPICLYLKGNKDLLANKNKKYLILAIVGTRQPTSYGIEVTRKFSSQLTEAGFVIVSGLAYGIDTIAHKSCLEKKGKTIAVLGCGVDIIYPAANRPLYENIIKNQGAIISEFPPGQTVLKGLFIARNRIISALSLGVMVVEGTKDSGSLITASYAADQGKVVFAVPSPITSELSQAPNLLIKNGAKMVLDIHDILEELNIKITPKKEEDIKKNLQNEEKMIFELLEKKPLKIDEICFLTKKSISEVLAILSILEIQGLVEKNLENRYQIKVF